MEAITTTSEDATAITDQTQLKRTASVDTVAFDNNKRLKQSSPTDAAAALSSLNNTNATSTTHSTFSSLDTLYSNYSNKQLDQFRLLTKNMRQLIESAMSVSVEHVLQALVAASSMSSKNNISACSYEDDEQEKSEVTGATSSLILFQHGRRKSRYEVRAADLAKEKTAECMRLQRELNDTRISNKELTSTISSLRDEYARLQTNLTNTTSALRIAASNAANAQCESDALHSKVETLIDELGKLKQEVQCVRELSKRVREEHEVLSNGCREVSSELMQCEAECEAGRQNVKRYEQRLHELNERVVREEEITCTLRGKLEFVTHELGGVNHRLDECREIDAQRVERVINLESSLREHKTLLVSATQTACEQECAESSLKESLIQLKAEAVRWQNSAQQQRASVREEREALSEQLEVVRKEKQVLQSKMDEMKEQMETQHLQCETQDKLVEQLQRRLAQFQQQQQQQTQQHPDPPTTVSPTTPSTSQHHHHPSKDNGTTTTTTTTLALPPLIKTPPSLLNHHNHHRSSAIATNNCNICGATPYGLMKSCPCGDVACTLRAHVTCMNQHKKDFIEQNKGKESSSNSNGYSMCRHRRRRS